VPGRQEISTDSRRRRSAATAPQHVDRQQVRGGQCRVDSRGTRLNSDLYTGVRSRYLHLGEQCGQDASMREGEGRKRGQERAGRRWLARKVVYDCHRPTSEQARDSLVRQTAANRPRIQLQMLVTAPPHSRLRPHRHAVLLRRGRGDR